MAGRIVSLNVSPGGLPKLPIDRAHVTRFGLEGDAHRNTRYHGGPRRAVCLYAAELIALLRAEGHDARPGSLGENVTVEGIDFAGLTPGHVVRLGDEVVLQVTSYTVPCRNIAFNFRDQAFSRLSAKLHPGQARLYARVLSEGDLAVGDLVSVEAGDEG